MMLGNHHWITIESPLNHHEIPFNQHFFHLWNVYVNFGPWSYWHWNESRSPHTGVSAGSRFEGERAPADEVNIEKHEDSLRFHSPKWFWMGSNLIGFNGIYKYIIKCLANGIQSPNQWIGMGNICNSVVYPPKKNGCLKKTRNPAPKIFSLLHVPNLPAKVLLAVVLLKVQGFHLNDLNLRSGPNAGKFLKAKKKSESHAMMRGPKKPAKRDVDRWKEIVKSCWSYSKDPSKKIVVNLIMVHQNFSCEMTGKMQT